MKELYEVLTGMLALFDELLAAEDAKLDAIAVNNIPALDECTKKEEALALKLRGVDKKREDAQAAMGMQGLTLRQMADKLEGPDGKKLKEMHEALSGKAKALNAALDSTRKVIELNQQSIDALLAARAAAEAGYEPTGEKKDAPEAPRFTPKEV